MDFVDREDLLANAADPRQSLYRISEVDETKLIGMHSSAGSQLQSMGSHMGNAGFAFSADNTQDPAFAGHQSPVGSPGGFQEPAKLFLNQQNLARAWDVSQRSTAQDWHEWLWKFNIDLLRESPIPTMRACASLAQAHEAMVRHTWCTKIYRMHKLTHFCVILSHSIRPPSSSTRPLCPAGMS
jgi:hypothetical protein